MRVDKEITIIDLAKELKVSTSTISRALTGHPSISKETKRKILKTADELGYRSNYNARNLRQQKTNAIGVIVHEINCDFIISVLEGIEKVTTENKYDIIIAHSAESAEKEIANSINLFNKRVDGLIVSLAANTNCYDHFAPFIKRKIPVVFFDRVEKSIKCTKVIIDNYKAGYDATLHLVEQGCKNIFHFTGDLKRNVYADRFKGYKHALKKNGLTFNVKQLCVTDLTEEATIKTVEEVLSKKNRPDGIFVSNDFNAAVCIKSLKRSNVKVPEEIAVVGFNNDAISRLVEPEITTVSYPGKKIGEVVAKHLIDALIHSGSSNNSTIILPSELIKRGSSLKRVTIA